jgi:hypothetical protein
MAVGERGILTSTDPWAHARAEFESRPPGPLAVYRNRPVAFAHDCIAWPSGQGLTVYQAEILEELPTVGRAAVRGPHGIGKTTLESIALLWFALTRDGDGDDWKVPTTASAWHQLTHYLWPEIHKWARRLRWDRIGRGPFSERTELLDLTLKLGTGEAFSASPVDAAKIEGAHADSLAYFFDEAKSIPAETFDSAEWAFAGAGSDTSSEAFALAMSTPGEPNGRFYDIHRRAPGYEDWWVRHVTIDEAVAAGRVSGEWVAQKARQWGEGSALYANRVLGEFAASDEDGVVPLAWIEAAVERWKARFGVHGERWSAPTDLSAVGADIARSGSDRTVFARRYGPVIGVLEYQPYSTNTMATAGKLRGILTAHGGAAIVDVIGIGAGVVDRLRETFARRRVVAFHASGASRRRDRTGEFGFRNARAEAWWRIRERLDPDSDDEPVLLPPDDLLVGDLAAPRWKVTSSDLIQIEDKDEVRSRLGRSTDSADAVIQSFVPLPRPQRSNVADLVGSRIPGM